MTQYGFVQTTIIGFFVTIVIGFGGFIATGIALYHLYGTPTIAYREYKNYKQIGVFYVRYVKPDEHGFERLRYYGSMWNEFFKKILLSFLAVAATVIASYIVGRIVTVMFS